VERPVKCHQCNRPAFFISGPEKRPLCLDCSDKLQNILNSQFIQNAAMMNSAMDHMDAMIPIGPPSGRIPIADLARAMQKSHVYNNIHVTNSKVGIINTGDLAQIDAAITMTEGTDVDQIGQHLKRLTQTVVDAQELADQTKREMIELIQSMSAQVVGPRKRSVIGALLKSLEERAKGANAVIELVTSLGSAIKGLFGDGA
jgi:hypothetical protein